MPRIATLVRSALVLVMLLAGGATHAQQPLFDGRTYTVGSDARSIVALQLNDDGQPELITGNVVGGPTLSILFSAGDATYIEGAGVGGSLAPRQLLAADMNGDGRDDLVSVHDSRVEVHLADGLSGLPLVSSVPTGGGSTRSAAAGDFNEDGKLDLAVAIEFNDGIAVLLGDGAGGLAAPVPYPVANILPGLVVQPHGIATGDFNEDGHVDLVTANYAYPSSLSVLLGDGHGAFGPPSGFAMSSLEQWAGDSVAVGDLDEDGHLDLVTGGMDTMHFGDGTGAFGPPVADPAQGRKLLADVDGDGHLDRIYISILNVKVARGDGHGGSAATDTYPIGALSALALTDIDGDGHLDIACAKSTQQPGDVRLLFNDGRGGFVRPPFTPLGAEPSRLTLGDLNRDGVTDVVTVNAEAHSLCVALGDGAGLFLAAATLPLDNQPNEVVIEDLNGDGSPDLAVALQSPVSPYPGSVRVLFGDGHGAFPASLDLPTGAPMTHLATGDVNEDGAPDLAAADEGNAPATRLWLADGSGGFLPPQTYAYESTGNTHDPSVVALRDLDGNHHLDLVIGDDDDERVSIRYGDGSGSLALQQTNLFGLGHVLAIADLDGDGDLDLAGQSNGSVPSGGGTLVVRFFQAGTWSAVVKYTSMPGMPQAADVDGDGDVDLVVDTADRAFRCMLNNGSGSFVKGDKFRTGMAGLAFALADLDGSGYADVVAVGRSAGSDVPPHISVQSNLTPSPWKNLGHALAGAHGVPQLVGKGTLLPGSPITLSIDHGRPSGSAALAIGLPAINAPFKGGIFVPLPSLLILGLPLDATGHFAGSGSWYSAIAPGTSVHFQAWIPDPSGPAGFTATNAIRGTTP